MDGPIRINTAGVSGGTVAMVVGELYGSTSAIRQVRVLYMYKY